MSDLANFLLARFAEDEEAWRGGLGLATRPDFSKLSRHMLADCDAKRRIVEGEQGSYTLRDDVGDVTVARWDLGGPDVVEVSWPGGPAERMSNAEFRERFMAPSPPSRVLRLLALPYADHPDYREEWRP